MGQKEAVQVRVACKGLPHLAHLPCHLRRRGATAWQQQDGWLTPFIEACSTPAARLLFAASGTAALSRGRGPLAACATATKARALFKLSHSTHPVGPSAPVAAMPGCAGLAGCNVSTAAPGVHTLAFSVQDSRGQRAAANRTLYVQQRCSAGERLCSDQVPG